MSIYFFNIFDFFTVKRQKIYIYATFLFVLCRSQKNDPTIIVPPFMLFYYFDIPSAKYPVMYLIFPGNSIIMYLNAAKEVWE